MSSYEGSDLLGTRSTTVEDRLRQSLRVLEDLNVDVPPGGRHRRALDVLSAGNQREPINLDDPEQPIEIARAYRIALNATHVAVAAYRSRRPGTPFTVQKLQQMMKDSFADDRSQSHARDIEFELLQAADLLLGDVAVVDGEPDLRIKYCDKWVGVAVKRVRSRSPRQIRKHVKKAEAQILKSGLRGWIAFNLDTRFEEVRPNDPEEEFAARASEIFETAQDTMETDTDGRNVIGLMLHGYATAWSQPDADDIPRLKSAEFERWTLYARDETTEDFRLAKGFFDACKRKRDQRLREIWNEDFVWRT